MRYLLACLASALTAGCIFTTEVVTRYDAACQIEVRQMVLTSQPFDFVLPHPCHDELCLYVLAGEALLVPVSAVISGSVLLIGNTVFWMEKHGRCADGKPQGA